MKVVEKELHGDMGRRPERSWWDQHLSTIIFCAISIWIGFLITMILTRGSSIGTPATPDAAFVAANERLLQMAQWTIATVLTLGGALIGLNWYQSEKRYEHDKEIFEERIKAEIESRYQEHKQQLNVLSQASVLTLDMESARKVKELVGSRDGSANDLGFLSRLFNNYSPNLHLLLCRGLALVLVEEIMDAGKSLPGSPRKLCEQDIREITSIAEDLSRDAPDLAAKLGLTLQGYVEWHSPGEHGNGPPT